MTFVTTLILELFCAQDSFSCKQQELRGEKSGLMVFIID